MSVPQDAATTLPFPGLRWGDYPERAEQNGGSATPRRTASAGVHLPAVRRVARVRARVAAWRGLSDHAFLWGLDALRQEVASHGLDAVRTEHCAAFAVEAAHRTLGLAAYDGQIVAALQMLDNRLVEMATGEGKSLAIALAAAAVALAGMPVHVLTANDYLVTRDAHGFAPMYEMLGLDVAAVVATDGPDQRRAAYAHAIVYATAKEVAFDYLRDRRLHGAGLPALQRRVSDLVEHDAPRPLLRGLCMAIVDEADSILIDEALTPLILSREGPTAANRAFLWQAWALSGKLVAGEHFAQVGDERQVTLLDAGREHVAELADRLQPVWKNTLHREATIVSALTARHVLQRDRDYVVKARENPSGDADTEVAIVDPTTGRIAEGRRWTGGLHALVAIKEGCRLDPDLETLARITFQRFFRRYHRLGGMSGTLGEARRELARVYGLTTTPVEPRRPNLRRELPTRWFATDAARWQAVVQRTEALRRAGRPVLIGTGSVAESASLSLWLDRAGIGHALLNANFDANEAAIIARAGVTGRVTVSTHMAGRGTDIVPCAAALRAGGLHVINCQLNPSRRLDRQLAGRAGRQGQPGSAEAWVSLEARRWSTAPALRALSTLARAFARDGGLGELRLPAVVLRALGLALQHWDERRDTRARTRLLREDCESDQSLAFAGRPE